VTVTGTVPDVRPFVEKAAVVVAPLRIARGVQNKVLEALAMGRPVLATPTCLAGLAARPGIELLAASEPEEWITAILKLFDDAGLRRQLGAAGRAYVERSHSWERCLGTPRRIAGRHGHAGHAGDSGACARRRT